MALLSIAIPFPFCRKCRFGKIQLFLFPCLQAGPRFSRVALEKLKNRKVAKLTKEYLEGLDRLQVNLTKANKFDEALEVRMETVRVKRAMANLTERKPEDKKPDMPEPEPDCSELEHGEEGCSEFVVACGQASEIFDLVEESLDQVALFIKRLAETVSLRSV